MQLHIQRGTEELGTFTLEETTQHLAGGHLLESDMAWREGSEEKIPLSKLLEQLQAQKEGTFDDGATVSPDEPGGKPTHTEDEPDPLFGDRYKRWRSVKLLGEGGMGQVWLAYDNQLERQVALKMVSGGQAIDTLRREVNGCLGLTHPHIIHIYDLVALPGVDPFISMEYIEGEDLTHKAQKKEGKRFSWQEIEPYIISLCDGLAYAHDHGMVHRDIKPQNLMITTEGELKLTDFGIATPLQEEDEGSDIQVPRAGTPVYWSPQQAQGMNPAPTDDIYSLGVTLFYLLVGEPPFKGPNEPALTYQHINEEPPHPQDKLKELGGKGKIPGYVSKLILKCLAKKPTERFQGAGDVQAWIKAKGDPVVKRQKRTALVSGVMGVVALAMGALAIWGFNQGTEAEGLGDDLDSIEYQLEKARALKEADRSNNIGMQHVQKGEHDKALEFLGEALAIRLEYLGTDHLDVAKSYNGIGMARKNRGDQNAALKPYQKALAIWLNQPEPDHQIVAGIHLDIGMVHHARAEFDKALEYYDKSLDYWLKELGPDHPHTAFIYNRIGLTYRIKGNFMHARENYMRALPIQIRDLGPNHHLTRDTQTNLELIAKERELGTVVDRHPFTLDLLAYYPFNGNANDDSENRNHGVVSGATLTADRNAKANSAYSFDGADDQISVTFTNAPLGNSARTLSLWLKADQLDPFNKHAINWGKMVGGQSFGVIKGHYADKHELIFYGQGLGTYDLNSNFEIDKGWHQIAVTYDKIKIRIYIDGTLKESGERHLNTSGTNLLIGAALLGGGNWKGELDDIRIYSRTLSAAEVRQLYFTEK